MRALVLGGSALSASGSSRRSWPAGTTSPSSTGARRRPSPRGWSPWWPTGPTWRRWCRGRLQRVGRCTTSPALVMAMAVAATSTACSTSRGRGPTTSTELDHGVRPVPHGIFPWTEDLAVQSRRHGQLRRLQGGGRTGDARPPRAVGLPASVVRPAAIYGPDNNIFDMEAPMFLRLRQSRPILVPHGGLVATSYGHVDDLCDVMVAMAGEPAAARSSTSRPAA